MSSGCHRRDKFVVTRKRVPDASQEVMAFGWRGDRKLSEQRLVRAMSWCSVFK